LVLGLKLVLDTVLGVELHRVPREWERWLGH
jgi:hypothetical protein